MSRNFLLSHVSRVMPHASHNVTEWQSARGKKEETVKMWLLVYILDSIIVLRNWVVGIVFLQPFLSQFLYLYFLFALREEETYTKFPLSVVWFYPTVGHPRRGVNSPIQEPCSRVILISDSGFWSWGMRMAENPYVRPPLTDGMQAIRAARSCNHNRITTIKLY